MKRSSKLGLVALCAVLVAVGLASREAKAKAPSHRSGAERVAAVREMAARAGLPDDWATFFALAAWRESKGNPNAKNDSDSEAAAAAKAYRRNADDFEACGYGEDAYEYSGGWFGIMPANGLEQLPASLRCLPPSAVFDPVVALAMAVGFARGLMRWDQYEAEPTWLNLRAMWGWPAMGGDAEYLEGRRPEYEEDAAEIGIPASWIDRRPPPLTVTPSQVLERLGFDERKVA